MLGCLKPKLVIELTVNFVPLDEPIALALLRIWPRSLITTGLVSMLPIEYCFLSPLNHRRLIYLLQTGSGQ